MSSTIKIKRGTRQAISDLAIKGGLSEGEPLLITDESRIAVATSPNNFQDFIKVGEVTSSGTVTSVGGTGTVSGLTLTGTVTSSGNLTLGGTLAVTPSDFSSQTANTVLAAPNGAAGVPIFRSIVAADIPILNQNTTGSAATLTTARTINGVSFNGSANILIPSIYDTNYRRIMQPGGGEYVTATGSITGALAIKLPTTVYTASSMVSFTVNVYEYNTGESIQIRINGYQHSASNWINCTAYILGSPSTNRQYSVRFAKDTTNLRYVVYIGELTTVWDYPQVYITDLQVGYGSQSVNWTTGWAIGFEATAFATVAATISNPQIGYSATANTANALVLRDASGNFSAGTITAALSGNASTATNLSTTRANWATNGTITAVVGQLAWRNYSNNHTIFDASAGLAPDGTTSVNNTNSTVAWTATYPTLMGWNGTNTYGVRVDSARLADSVTNGVYTTGDQTIGGLKTFSNYVVFSKTTTITVGTAGGSDQFQIQNAGTGATVLSFHRTGAYAINMGLDTDNVFRLGGWSNGTNTYRIQSDTAGNFTTQGNVTAYSDERLKKNWSGMPQDFIERLSGVKHGTYDRIDNGERQVGVSAQELQKILPEAVQEDINGTLSVSYGNAALVAAVELAREVQELKAIVMKQQELINKLTEKLERLVE